MKCQFNLLLFLKPSTSAACKSRTPSGILTFTRGLHHIEADEHSNRGPARRRQMLRDQEPYAADRGCTSVSIQIVVLMSTFIN